MKWCIVLIVIINFSCNTKKELRDLIEKETIYFYKDSFEPFSGKVISTGKNLKGKDFVSSFYHFQSGIPVGNWKSFGYHGEIIQEGYFKPITEVAELRSDFPHIVRINICRYYEGEYEIIDLYVISKKPKIDSTDFFSKKGIILSFLRKKSQLTEHDHRLVNSCQIYSGEF